MGTGIRFYAGDIKTDMCALNKYHSPQKAVTDEQSLVNTLNMKINFKLIQN